MIEASPASAAPASVSADGPGDEVDYDAIVRAVRRAPGVDDLDAGALGSIATYLPGRQIGGLRVTEDRVTVQVRIDWNVRADRVAAAITEAVRGVAPGRSVDVVVSDIVTPGSSDAAAPEPAAAVTTPQPRRSATPEPRGAAPSAPSSTTSATPPSS